MFDRVMPFAFVAAVVLILLLATEAVEGATVLVVRGTETERSSREGGAAKTSFEVVRDSLQLAGVAFDTAGDEDVVAGKLWDYKMVILCYNPRMQDMEVRQLAAFYECGGKLVTFYSFPRKLMKEIGLGRFEYTRAEPRGRFSSIRSSDRAPAGTPARFDQSSHNIYWVDRKSTGEGMEVVAEWFDADGKETGAPAVLLSRRAAWFSHVLLSPASPEKGGFLKAVLQHLEAHPVPQKRIAVVDGTVMSVRAPSENVEGFRQAVEKALQMFAVEYDLLTDEAVARGRLAGYDVAVFPYNNAVTDEELEKIVQYVSSGGKVFWFYGMPGRLAETLGVSRGKRVADRDRTFSVRLERGRGKWSGLPNVVSQSSWNIQAVEPVSPDAYVLGIWLNKDGNPSGLNALTVSPRGAYFAHVLIPPVTPDKARMIVSVVAGLAGPEMESDLWAKAARVQIEKASGPVGSYSSLSELRRAARRRARGMHRHSGVAAELRKSDSELERAKEMLDAGKPFEAYEAAQRAREHAVRAYGVSLAPPRKEDIRAVWLHRPELPSGFTGDSGWRDMLQTIARCRFNALIINMCSAGYADYPSDVLPPSDFATEHPDFLPDLVRLGKQTGVEIHVWIVCVPCSRGRESWIKKLVEANRLACKADGTLTGRGSRQWLCPSHPENRKLMAEIARELAERYHPDGVHYDYIRYGGEMCYCDGCRKRFERDCGVRVADWPKDVFAKDSRLYERYRDWERRQIDAALVSMAEAVKKADPAVDTSAAVFSRLESARRNVMQDWGPWVRKELLDLVCPMSYTSNLEDFRSRTETHVPLAIGTRVKILPGIGVTSSHSSLDAEALLMQIDAAERLHANGFVVFELNGLTPLLPDIEAWATVAGE